MKNRIEFICGCMFSGKTTELLRRIRREKIAKKNIILFSSHRDKRCESGYIKSHDDIATESIVIDYCDDVRFSCSKKILTHINDNIDVVGIDEIQFFDKDIVEVCKEIADSGKKVIIAGLTLNFKAEPFSPQILELLALAEEVKMLTAICVECGEDATRSMRIDNEGNPVSYFDDIYKLDNQNNYIAVCRKHFKILDNPNVKVK